MSKSFEDLLSKVSECEMKKVAVAVAQDSAVLEAVCRHIIKDNGHFLLILPDGRTAGNEIYNSFITIQ